MKYLYETGFVYRIISSTLMNFYNLARMDLKKNWKNMDKRSRCNVARGLVNMRAVAKNPEKYFSRFETYASWTKRANDYIKSRNEPADNTYNAYYIVAGPVEVVTDSLNGCIMNQNLQKQYDSFCRMVVDWEYNRTSFDVVLRSGSNLNVNKIMNVADMIKQQEYEKSHALLMSLKSLFKNKKHNR